MIDASGSMAGDKLENAKAAALGVAERLGPVRPAVHRELRRRRRRARRGPDPVRRGHDRHPGGHRRAAHARQHQSERGLAHWRRVRRPGGEAGGVNRVILLSDGAANVGIVDPVELAIHAAELAKRGVVTSCVGIGDGYETPVLRAIAEAGGGRLHDAEVGSEIVDALLGELGEIGDLVAQDVSITLHVPATAKAEFMGSAPTQVGAGSLSVSVGAIIAGRPRTCVFRVTLPAGHVGDTLLFGFSAHGAAPGGAALDVRPAEASIAFGEGALNTKQPRDEAASMAVALAWHAEIVRRAAQLNRKGERRQARRFVERELQFFERYCAVLPQALPLVREITVLKQNVDREWDERTRKEMEVTSYMRSTNSADYRPARASWSTR